MTPAELTPGQRVAIALRLHKRVVVREEAANYCAVGLAAHGTPGCCRPGQPVLIDFHSPMRPEDVIGFCPAEVPGIDETAAEVAEAMRIYGYGLGAYSEVERLPRATVAFLEAVEGARARFEAEAQDARRTR